MPKLENFVTFIKINGNPFAKNAVNYQITNDDSVGIYYTNDRDQRMLKGTMARFDDWTDLNNNSYTSFTQLTDDLNSFLFYLNGSDYNLEVLRGNIPGHSMVNIRGHDDTVPNGGPFGLSPEFGDGGYSFDQSAIDRAATPAVIGVASTDNTNDNVGGTGALTARVFGLDASGNAQTNDVTLTGTTAVNTGSIFSAVFQILVLTTGSNNANTGIIYVGTGSFTAGVPAVRMLSMDIGFNVSLSAYYVVPLGKTFFPRQFIFTIQTSNKDAAVTIETSTDGLQWVRQIEFGLEGGQMIVPVIALPGFVTGTHVQLQALGSAASTAVTGILAGELIDA